MLHRSRTIDESALLKTVMSAVADVLPANDLEMLQHPDPASRHMLALRFDKKINVSDIQNILHKLEQNNIYNSYGGIRFSEKDNGLFIDLGGFTDSPVHKPNPLVSAQLLSSEMERYIAIDKYNDYEEGHPGYHEMMNAMRVSTLGTIKKGNQGKVLEIGAGTGNFTRKLGNTNRVKIKAIEIDPNSAEYMGHKIENGQIINTSLIVQDALKWAKGEQAESKDAVVTAFSDHHFSPKQKPEFLKSITRLLKTSGAYVVGDEFLPPHDEKNPAERVSAQIAYHGMVIEEAFKEGKVELPKLELDALISGLRTTVTFIQQTAPEHKDNDFRVRPGARNNYNKNGVELLGELVTRLDKIAPTVTANPERLDSATIVEQRKEFIQRLKDLQNELEESRRAGLQEDLSKGKVGGDYKMTIRQYTQALEQAGLRATGYFEGPKPVGAARDELDHGTNRHPIGLKPTDNYHSGGVWVIKATMDRENRNEQPSVLR